MQLNKMYILLNINEKKKCMYVWGNSTVITLSLQAFYTDDRESNNADQAIQN